MPQYSHCSGDTRCSWALGWGAWRAQAGTAGVRGRWAWRAGRHGRRAWALGVARRQAGSSSALAQRALGRARQAGRRQAGRARQAECRRAGTRGARGLGAWAGQDCALGAPDLIFKPVFDSVFFLSQ